VRRHLEDGTSLGQLVAEDDRLGPEAAALLAPGVGVRRRTSQGGAEDVRREQVEVRLLTHIGNDSDGELVFASGSGDIYRAVPPDGS